MAAVLGVLCVIALGGGLTACGEDEQDRAGPAALDTARLAKVHRLSSQQYQAIRRVFDAGDEVDRSDNSGLSADIILQPILDACKDRAEGDPLLVALFASCTDYFRFEIALVEALPCAGTDGCSDLYDDARGRLQTSVRSARLSDRAVEATRLPRACKRVLAEDPSEYRQARRYDRTLAALQAATRTASTSDDAIAGRRLARTFRTDPSMGSASNLLKGLRRSCRRRS